jgi:hypothetical protein
MVRVMMDARGLLRPAMRWYDVWVAECASRFRIRGRSCCCLLLACFSCQHLSNPFVPNKHTITSGDACCGYGAESRCDEAAIESGMAHMHFARDRDRVIAVDSISTKFTCQQSTKRHTSAALISTASWQQAAPRLDSLLPSSWIRPSSCVCVRRTPYIAPARRLTNVVVSSL